MPTIACPCCGRPLRQYEQTRPLGRPALVLADCWTRGCELYAVTLTAGEHARLTPEQIAAYGRVSVMRQALALPRNGGAR